MCPLQYKIPLTVVSYKELYGWTMDEIVREVGTKNNCTFCGVFRRQVSSDFPNSDPVVASPVCDAGRISDSTCMLFRRSTNDLCVVTGLYLRPCDAAMPGFITERSAPSSGAPASPVWPTTMVLNPGVPALHVLRVSPDTITISTR